MKAIDTHVHPCFGAGDIRSHVAEWGIDFTPEGLDREMRAACVERIVAIPDVRDLVRSNKEMREFAMGRPGRAIALYGVSEEAPRNLESRVTRGGFRGIKLFPGYFRRFIDDRRWRRAFHVATELRIPVVIHTGDVFAFEPGLRVKYAHPLPADDAAAEFPDCTIVLAHTGNPWIADACEVAYKNPNVHLDLSAWWIGRPDPFVLRVLTRQLEYVVAFAGPKKAMFATDWPIVPMNTYRRFLERAKLPGIRDILYGNARRVFWGE